MNFFEVFMSIIKNDSFDEERAFYGSVGATLEGCRFDGPADGESAFKEARNISVKDCFFNLRYPFWHDEGARIVSSEMTESCRAALWYSRDIEIRNSRLHGIKALRECRNVSIEDTSIISPEFGWFSEGVEMKRSSAAGEYFMMRSKDLHFEEVSLKGKYSFQYVEDSVIESCDLDTKDAFWHAKNVTVRNSRIKGEYLAWYSENLTLENCVIIGTQPLCYCKGLKLVNCEMHGCDLSFERSEVEATLTREIDSIKNPISGSITAPSIGELIDEYNTKCKIEVTKCLV